MNPALIARFASLLGGAAGKGGGGAGAAGGAGGAGGGGEIQNLMKAVSGLAGAAGAAVGALTGMVATANHFVQALDPALSHHFGVELKNLSATIGGALRPIIETAIPIVRQLSALFLDLSQELQPIIAELSNAIGAEFIAIVRLLAFEFKVILQLLRPLITLTSMYANAVAQGLEVWVAFGKAVFDTISEMLATVLTMDDIISALKSLERMVYRIAGLMAQSAARILMFLGMTDLLNKFKANIQAAINQKLNPNGGLLAAPEGVQTGDITSIARKFAEKAFVATGGGAGEKPEVGLLREILKGLNAVEDGNGLRQMLVEVLGQFFPKIPENARQGMQHINDASATPARTAFGGIAPQTRAGAVFGAGGSVARGGTLGLPAELLARLFG